MSSHAKAPRAASGVPSKVGRYEIVGPLASGGMAEVLLARYVGSHGFERPVVVKRMLPHLARDHVFVRMFIDEARIVAGIHHPNVVQTTEFDSDGDDLYLVMEYLEGETVAGLMRRMSARDRWIDAPLAAFVVAQACAGLHAAHELAGPDGTSRQLVHRDVSPQNIFVTYEGVVKVLDFGIAKAADRITRTQTGQLKGKESYMSPEQAQALPLDRRSDIFSLGIVLYELTTRRRLFKRRSKLETLEAVRDADVRPPSLVLPGYPTDLEAVCTRALARRPDDRFPTAAAMRRELLGAARSAGLDTVPDEALARWMQDLFADRIAQKSQTLQSLQSGQPVSSLPVAETDLSVDLPGLDSEVSAVVAARGAEAVAASTAEPSGTEDASMAARHGDLPKGRSVPWYVPPLLAVMGLLAVALGILWWQSRAAEPRAPTPAALPATAPAEPRAPAPAEAEQPVPPPPTVPEEVVVELESTPPGATVIVNDEERGETPLSVRLPRGSEPASIELRLEGYEPILETVRTDVNGRLRLALVKRRPAFPGVRRPPRRPPRGKRPPAKEPSRPVFRAFD